MTLHPVSRRAFLARGTRLAAGALAGFTVLRHVTPSWAKAARAAPRTMRYRTLGRRTGLKVSEIGFGGYPVRDPDVLHRAIDLGITFVDTSDDYRGGDSERVIGRTMTTRRKEVVLATKWHPWGGTTKAEMLATLDGCLKRLATDHVDLIQVHQVGKASGAGDGDGGGDPLDRLKNPELHEAFAAAKKAGKARFLGATGHDGDLMAIMGWVVESGRFDTMLCRYNFMDYPEQHLLFEKAEKAGMGIVVMKTLSGARQEDLKPFQRDGATFAQAALKWVLANPHLDTAVISVATKAQAEEYAGASGAPLTRADLNALEAYAARHSRDYCRMCNACETACPASLPVADLLRARMYHEGYGETERARELWARSTARASPASCAGCSAPCLALCPWEVPIKRKLNEAREALG